MSREPLTEKYIFYVAGLEPAVCFADLQRSVDGFKNVIQLNIDDLENALNNDEYDEADLETQITVLKNVLHELDLWLPALKYDTDKLGYTTGIKGGIKDD